MRITVRGIQIALGVLWLLAGALQLQPFMLGPGFSQQIIAPAAQGQPRFVAAGVTWAASLIAVHPAFWDFLFAGTQLALGVALLVRPLARIGLIGSVAWGLGVWYLGEGLGGLASGHADLLTGAPGAVLLYVVLAVAAFPQPAIPRTWQPRDWARTEPGQPPAWWLPTAWAVLWVGAGLLRALPGQNTAAAISAEVTDTAGGGSGLVAHADHVLIHAVRALGTGSIVLAVAVEVLIGLLALRPGPARTVAAWAGIVVAAVLWVAGQGLGELASGQSTDPNTAPLIVLMGIALLGCRPLPQPAHQAARDSDRQPGHNPRADPHAA